MIIKIKHFNHSLIIKKAPKIVTIAHENIAKTSQRLYLLKIEKKIITI